MPNWMRRMGQRETTPAPRPRTGDGGDDHEDERARADGDDGRVDERLHDRRDRVPHIERAGDAVIAHELERRHTAVVVAKEPMPKVSKKFVTKPMRSPPAFGLVDSPGAGSDRSTRTPAMSRTM